MSRKAAVVPLHTTEYFPKGTHCTTTVPGDMILVRHHGLAPFAIRCGERVRYFFRRNFLRQKEFEKVFCKVNHSMGVVEGGQEATVSQMAPSGGSIVELLDYIDLEYAVVHPTVASEKQMFAAASVGEWTNGLQYGWVSIIGMFIDSLVPFFNIALGYGQRIVCSTQQTQAQRCVGFIPDFSDDGMYPADLARCYDVRF
jgi:hypothetical protein